MKRSHGVEATESITHVTGRKLDFAIIGALVIALGFVVYNYVLEDGSEATGVLPSSVAVLLCDNLSPDPDDITASKLSPERCHRSPLLLPTILPRYHR